MKNILLLTVLMIGCSTFKEKEGKGNIELIYDYMGQERPGLVPKKFAPGFISTNEYAETYACMHPNGKEFYYTAQPLPTYETFTLMVSKLVGGKWSKPKPLWEGDGMGSAITRDGMMLYFGSIDLTDENDSLMEPNLWVMDREGDSWSDPRPLGPEVNTPDEGEWFPSTGDDGTLYFKAGKFKEGIERIFYTKMINGSYHKPKLLEASFNSKYFTDDPFMAPDESYMIFIPINRPDLAKGMYISFQDSSGKWSAPKPMGIDGMLPSLSPDGKYLFFTKNSDMYWVDARIIETFR